MYKLTKRSPYKRAELSLKKKTSFFTPDLFKGLCLAFCMHLALFLCFRIDRPMHDEQLLPLDSVAVEVDRKSLELKPLFFAAKTDLSIANRPLLELPELTPASLPAEKKEYLLMRCCEPDFAEIEKISYSSSLERLALQTHFTPLRLTFAPEEALELTEKSQKLLNKKEEKKGPTAVYRLFFQAVIDSFGKVARFEYKERWGEYPEAVLEAKKVLKKIRFKKGKEMSAEIEIWLELPLEESNY